MLTIIEEGRITIAKRVATQKLAVLVSAEIIGQTPMRYFRIV